ncbi:MAG TPA: efflux RND transporter periplasmic adaptor subunit [Alphaproteobacteria bacterium]|nr:efflux RND transporter periplasmic adaptor subunit [Alphaproteobacteria bacterium]
MSATHAAPSYSQPGAPRPKPKLVRWLIIVGVILIVVLGAFYGFEQFRKNAIAKFFAGNKPPPTTINVALAQSEPMSRFLDAIGTVAAVNQVTIAPQVAGRVVKLAFESGATVKQGDPLVQLDDATERADLANYQAQAKLATANLQRARTLAQEKYATQASVDQQQSQLDVARAGVARSQALIDQKLIKAPFAGDLGIRQVDLGQYVGPGTAIVSLTKLDQVYVDFTLPEQARSQLNVGLPVQISADAFPGKSFDAKISTIEPQIDPTTRAIKVRATMDNPERLLQPGMFARARVVLPPQPDVITVPETSVDYTVYGQSVFLIQEDGKDEKGQAKYKAVQTFVTAGARQNGRVAIVKGLNSGDMVANAGQTRIFNGSAVIPSDQGGLTPPAQTPVQ